jgi:hypothetical protein
MFVTLCVWVSSHIMLWLLGFYKTRTFLSTGSRAGENYYFVPPKTYSISRQNCRLPLTLILSVTPLRIVAVLTVVVALNAAMCIAALAGFEKLAQRTVRSCGLLPDLTSHMRCVCSRCQSGTQSTCIELYCHLWPVRLYHIFPNYLTNGTIFGKQLMNIKCFFWFSLQLLSETFLIQWRFQQNMIITVLRSSCGVPVIFVRF